MARTTARSCPVCDGAPQPCFAAGGFDLFRCTRCRTAYVDPLPDDEFLADFYARYHLSDEEGGAYDEVESRMQADFPAKLALMRRTLGPGAARVLDVGCGKGYFVRACADAGFDALGCDLSKSGVRFANERLGVRAFEGQVRDLKRELGPGSFDGVTFWATIEHLPDPVGFVGDLAELLKPGGHLFLDTGIGDDWLDRLVPGAVQWYDPPQHLFVFSADGLRRTVERAGLVIVAHDRCFERSAARRAARIARGWVAGSLLRLSAAAGRVRSGERAFTRFPLGNLQSVVARRPPAAVTSTSAPAGRGSAGLPRSGAACP